ncbi:MAG TPA: metal ABC transporter substrate-binding protein [Gemmatimonadales bacterium]|jgi:zinc/manganese transport system substrate-binding protein|nr:metal ABC transporter substrate-binding protein [Gemmatimonadales bacterium]
MQITNALRVAAIALILVPGPGTSAAKKLNVIATTPDLAAIAREIGGDAIDVAAMAKPTEDPHFVDAKPSFLVALNRADVLIEGGAELELGWLPPLLDNARNAKIAPGAPGRIVASEGVRLLEVPTSFDRSRGDVHALGNPHYLIDPLNAKIVAANIAAHLAHVDPASASIYQANLARFNQTLDARMTEWRKQLEPFRDAKIVTYHKDFVYFAQRFDLDIVGELEPKPGIAPSPAHLAEVITTMKSTHARAIIVQPFQNRRTAETVARQTDGVVLDISQQPGAIPNTATYFDLMDYVVRTLATALGNSK